MSLIIRRNEFITNILSYIIKSYNSDSEESLLLRGNTVILFGKMQFNIEKPFRGIEYLDERGKIISDYIELAVSYSQFNDFLRHLSQFGILCLKKLEPCSYHDDIYVELTVLYNPKLLIPFFEENLFYKFLIEEKYKELGKLTLRFNIMLMHDNYTFTEIPKGLLSETIYGEYIKELDMFCFNNVVTYNTTPYNTICLEWVLQSCKIFDDRSDDQTGTEKKIELWDGNFIDIHKSIEMILENKDKLVIKILKIKEENIINKNYTCTICLDSIIDKGFKTSCNHYFHSECIVRFLTKYYKDLYTSCMEDRSLTVEYDIQGNVLHGAVYEFSCPNCKNQCFKLDCCKDNETNLIIIKNPENCIFEMA